MAYGLKDIVNKIFDAGESIESRKNALDEFQAVMSNIDINKVKQEDLLPALKKINVSVDIKPFEKEAIDGILSGIMSKVPSTEKLDELNIPLLAAHARNVEVLEFLAQNPELDFIKKVHIEGTDIRGASVITLTGSNKDAESQKMFDICTNRQFKLEGKSQLNVGDWVGKALGVDTIDLVLKRFEKYKDKLEISQFDISSTLLAVNGFLTLEKLSHEKESDLTAFRKQLLSRVNLSQVNPTFNTIPTSRVITSIDDLDKENKELRASNNEFALICAALSPTEVSYTSYGVQNIDESFKQTMMKFEESVDDLSEKNRVTILASLISPRLSKEHNLISLISDEAKLNALANELINNPGLQRELDELVEKKPHLKPYKVVIDAKVQQLIQARGVFTRMASNFNLLAIGESKKSLDNFLIPHMSEDAKTAIEMLDVLKQNISNNKALSEVEKADLLEKIDSSKSGVMEASFYSSEQVSKVIDRVVNEEVIAINSELIKSDRINNLEDYVKRSSQKHGLVKDKAYMANLKKEMDKLKGLTGEELDECIGKTTEKHFEKVVDTWYQNQKNMIEKTKDSFGQKDLNERQQSALERLETKYNKIKANIAAKGMDYINDVKDNPRLLTSHTAKTLSTNKSIGSHRQL